MTFANPTPAQIAAGLIGVLLVTAGILGLVENSSFDTGEVINGDKLTIFEVNGWNSLAALVGGAIALLVAAFPAAAKWYTLVLGAIFLVAAVWGILDRDSVANLFPVNKWNILFDLAVGTVLVDASLVSAPGKRYRLTSR
jgi:hypothetical protein